MRAGRGNEQPHTHLSAFRGLTGESIKVFEKQSTAIKGGKRPGAGRKKGVPNRRTAELQAQVEAEGITPLEYLLRLMRDEEGDPRERMTAAVAAAPYVHAKLAAVEVSGDVNMGVTIQATPLDERL